MTLSRITTILPQNSQAKRQACTRAEQAEGVAAVLTGVGLAGQGIGYLAAAASVPEGDVPGAIAGALFAQRASILTSAGASLGIAVAAISALNGNYGPAAAEAINATVAGKLAPQGAVRDAIEAALDKLDSGAIAKALGCG